MEDTKMNDAVVADDNATPATEGEATDAPATEEATPEATPATEGETPATPEATA